MTSSPSGIVTYHTDPNTCGVARFNFSLAEAFEIPVIKFSDWVDSSLSNPVLLSLKPSEMSSVDQNRALKKLEGDKLTHLVFLHEFENTPLETMVTATAKRVVAVDRLVAEKAKLLNNEVICGFAPGISFIFQDKGTPIRLLSLGMAHKVNGTKFGQLSRIVEIDARHFELRISTAVHEGFTVGASFSHVSDQINKNWNLPFTFLGFISDSLLNEELEMADAVVIFPMSAARESNSSILGALRFGKAVITWLDADSPRWMKHHETLFDVNAMSAFPSNTELLQIGKNAAEVSKQFDYVALRNLFL